MTLRSTLSPTLRATLRGTLGRPSGFRGLANEFPGGALGLSLRLLNRRFADLGIVGVRRDSDSDIAFVKVDKSFAQPLITLNSPLVGSSAIFGDFVSGTDGLVTDWIDQFNLGGNDATQTTTTEQPKIVDTGSLVVGGLDFDGVDDFFDTPLVLSSTNAALIAVASREVGVTGGIIDARDGLDDGYELTFLSTGNARFSAGATDAESSAATTGEFLVFGNYDGSDASISVDGSVTSQAGVEVISTTNTVLIGQRFGGQFLGGTINEAIIYASDQSANRTGIETNINDFYSIY